MRWVKKVFFLIFLASFFLVFWLKPVPIEAASFDKSFEQKQDSSLEIVVNEICWMGNNNSSFDEWIELFNNTEKAIDLSGWRLIAQDASPKVNLKGLIAPKGFFVLERTDDQTLKEISADLIYKGSLSNKGESLQLIDKQGRVVDQVNFSSGWPKGNNKSKRTMERVDPQKPGSNPQNWQTSQEPGGTPGVYNSQGFEKEVGQAFSNRPGILVEKPELLAQNKELKGPFLSQASGSRVFTDPGSFSKTGLLDFLLVFLSGFSISFLGASLVLFFKKRLNRPDRSLD